MCFCRVLRPMQSEELWKLYRTRSVAEALAEITRRSTLFLWHFCSLILGIRLHFLIVPPSTHTNIFCCSLSRHTLINKNQSQTESQSEMSFRFADMHVSAWKSWLHIGFLFPVQVIIFSEDTRRCTALCHPNYGDEACY